MTQRQSRCVRFSNNDLAGRWQRTNHRPICDFSQKLRLVILAKNCGRNFGLFWGGLDHGHSAVASGTRTPRIKGTRCTCRRRDT